MPLIKNVSLTAVPDRIEPGSIMQLSFRSMVTNFYRAPLMQNQVTATLYALRSTQFMQTKESEHLLMSSSSF